MTVEKLKRSIKYRKEIKQKLKFLSKSELEAINEKLQESVEAASGFPSGSSLLDTLRKDLRELRDLVRHHLDTKCQSQSPAPSHDPSVASGRPGTSQRGGSDVEGSGELSRDSLSDSELLNLNETYSIHQNESQEGQMYEELIKRIDSLEQKNLNNEKKFALYEEKICTLERKNSELEEANHKLESDLVSRIEQIERSASIPQRTTMSVQPDVTESINQHEHLLQELQQSIDEHTSHFVTIRNIVEHEFSTSFGHVDRDDKLDTIIIDVQKQVDELTRDPPQPQCTPWQYWKRKACELLQISNEKQRPAQAFRCYEDNCGWRNKHVTLNAYIQHLKSPRHHAHNIRTRPLMTLQPKLEV